MKDIEKIGSLTICKEDDLFYIKLDGELLLTPGGNKVDTFYIDIARQICKDIIEQGDESYYYPDSILSYHYTTIDNLSGLDTDEIIEELNSSNWQGGWSLLPCPSANPDVIMKWTALFGERESRIKEINVWLGNCSVMQLSAVLCVYNAFMNMNMAYLMAIMVEASEEKDHENILKDIMEFYTNFDDDISYKEAWKIFERFRLYYGVHFKESGPCVPKTNHQ